MGLKCRFSALLILLAPTRQHALCQAMFSADLSRTPLSCGDLAHDLQFKLATVDPFVHVSSPCLFSVYDMRGEVDFVHCPVKWVQSSPHPSSSSTPASTMNDLRTHIVVIVE